MTEQQPTRSRGWHMYRGRCLGCDGCPCAGTPKDLTILLSIIHNKLFSKWLPNVLISTEIFPDKNFKYFLGLSFCFTQWIACCDESKFRSFVRLF